MRMGPEMKSKDVVQQSVHLHTSVGYGGILDERGSLQHDRIPAFIHKQASTSIGRICLKKDRRIKRQVDGCATDSQTSAPCRNLVRLECRVTVFLGGEGDRIIGLKFEFCPTFHHMHMYMQPHAPSPINVDGLEPVINIYPAAPTTGVISLYDKAPV